MNACFPLFVPGKRVSVWFAVFGLVWFAGSGSGEIMVVGYGSVCWFLVLVCGPGEIMIARKTRNPKSTNQRAPPIPKRSLIMK